MQDKGELRKAMKEFYNTSDYYLQWLKKPESYFNNYLCLIRKHALLGTKVLDIGCGPGISSNYISKAGFDVIGLDISLKYLKFLNKNQRSEGLKLVNGDVLSLPFKNSIFDIIGVFQTIEHIIDVPQALEEIIRITRKGGKILITVPNYTSPYFALNSIFWTIKNHTIPRLGITLKQIISGSIAIFKKALSSNATFIYQTPIIGNEWSWADEDAVYVSHVIDLVRFFNKRGIKTSINYTTSTLIEGAIKRTIGSLFAPSVWLIATKK